MFPERENTSDLSITKNGATYAMPCGWSLKDSGSVEFRQKITDRAFAHGGTATGDGKVKGKTITVEFDLKGATEQEHDEAVNLAYQRFTQADYLLTCGRTDRVYKVAACSKISADFEKGFKQRWSKIKVSLLLADPFRYSATQTIVTSDYATDQAEAEITFCNDSSVDVPLIWTFTPTTTVPSILVTHNETGQQMRVTDTLLTAPAIAVVNAETGTVRRDTGNSLNTFSGIFLHAQPGQNTFKYTGASCRVDVAYTERWLV